MLTHLKLKMSCSQDVIEFKQTDGCHCAEIERQALGSLQYSQRRIPLLIGTEGATYWLILCLCERDERIIGIRVVPISEYMKRRRYGAVSIPPLHFGFSLLFQDLEHLVEALPHFLFGGPEMHGLDELGIGEIDLPSIAAQVICPNILRHDLTDSALPLDEARRQDKLVADLLPNSSCARREDLGNSFNSPTGSSVSSMMIQSGSPEGTSSYRTAASTSTVSSVGSIVGAGSMTWTARRPDVLLVTSCADEDNGMRNPPQRSDCLRISARGQACMICSGGSSSTLGSSSTASVTHSGRSCMTPRTER